MKRFLLILLIYFNLIPLHAQDMRQIWVEMPDTLVPYLNKSLRTELADYITMRMKSAVVQTWNGPKAESKLMLFSKEWEAKPFELDCAPVFEKTDSMSQQRYNELLSMANVMLCELELSENDNSLTIKYDVPLLSPADKKDISIILKQRKLNWNGYLFK